MLIVTADQEQGEFPEIEILRAALDSYVDRFGPLHPLAIDVVERLAVAFWHNGGVHEAVDLLDRTLRLIEDPDDPARLDLLGLLWKIRFAQRAYALAASILMEIHERCVSRLGDCHPDSLSAEGDLAIVLFEAGQLHEAEVLGSDALAKSFRSLGKTHRVSCVLAWNRALFYERRNEATAARELAMCHLLWLLAEDPSALDADLREIREWLADRLNWPESGDTAPSA